MGMRVLVTGAAGSLGRVVTQGLTDLGHHVDGLDLVPQPSGWTGGWWQGDCADGAWVDQALAESAPEAIVHLAGYPDEQNLQHSLTSHTTTTAALLDAMVEQGITRLVHASSNHAVGRTRHGKHSPAAPLGVTTPARPDTFYGVAKVAAEAVLSLYADRYGIDAVVCRIGSFLPRPTTHRHLATWLSHPDCVRMIHAALTTPAPGFAVLYGISANTRAWWDLEPGRTLGYAPLDDAETYTAHLQAREEDDFEDRYVGGPFAGQEFHLPALGTEPH